MQQKIDLAETRSLWTELIKINLIQSRVGCASPYDRITVATGKSLLHYLICDA